MYVKVGHALPVRVDLILIFIDNAEVKQSVTDYSDSQPHHQSYSSQGTSFGFKCIENRSICINIHLFFWPEEW